jgi:hypothetical protein
MRSIHVSSQCTNSFFFTLHFTSLLPVHRFARDPAAYCIKTCAWFSSTVPLQLTVNVRYNFTFHSPHCKRYASHCTLHTADCTTFHPSPFTLPPSTFTLHTANVTLNFALFTLHTAHCNTALCNTSHYPYHTAHFTFYTAHFPIHPLPSSRPCPPHSSSTSRCAQFSHHDPACHLFNVLVRSCAIVIT